MSAENNVILIGRLTKEVALNATSSGMNVGRFTLAVNRSRKVDGQPNADFINCVCFSKTAETIAKFFTKGNKIAISGHIQTGSYEKDGQKIYTTDVIVDTFAFVESKASSGSVENSIQSNVGMAIDGFVSTDNSFPEELPFT